jgi:predicted DNA-binding transcriptional regulator AlpA
MRDVSLVPSALLDASELARLLCVSKPTIWRLRENAKLPVAITLTSQCIRWRRSDVESWIANGCPPLDEQRSGAAEDARSSANALESEEGTR